MLKLAAALDIIPGMQAAIAGIEYHLPPNTVTTDDLSVMFPGWDVQKTDAKTGIRTRHIAAHDECASDLAVVAAQRLFDSGACSPNQIDFLLFCTQSPDYALPTTACLLQDRLGIPTTAGALDFNLGSSGFVYGLGLAQGLIAAEQVRTVLLVTAETYSKYLAKDDKGSRAIFGDAAAATLLLAQSGGTVHIGPFVYGTDGKGGEHLMVPGSGARPLCRGHLDVDRVAEPDSWQRQLHMNGNQIFHFATTVVPRVVYALLKAAHLTLQDVDLYVFHQANAYILEEVRRILEIPMEKLQLTIDKCGNTASSTIPIALKAAHCEGRLRAGALVMLVGFGPGYSWGGTLVRWTGLH
jgi:3-oxoacyl-[acyl-carrier-protein] synthase III